MGDRSGTASGADEALQQSAAGDTARRILDHITAHRLKSGDRLPSVRSLAEMLGVAAPTVREALQRLEVTGTVQMRHGSGTYVAVGAHRPILANPHSAAPTHSSLTELLETRLLLEPQLAEQAAMNGTLADVRELEATIDRAGAILGGPDDGLFGTNMGFHRIIARMSGNQIAASVIASLTEIYREEQYMILHIFDNRKDLNQHRKILERILLGDTDGARESMHTHLSEVLESVVRATTEGRITTLSQLQGHR